MVVQLLSKLDMENGGTGAPSVITPGQRWLFRGFIPEGGEPQAGQFIVNGGSLTTYNIGSVIGANDVPTVDVSGSPHGTYLFEYNIEQCDIGTLLTLSNTSCPTCNAGTSEPITVCNSGCTVNLFEHLMGDPDSGGAWSHVSGPATLSFSGGDLGTVNFSGKPAGSYVARYTVLSCTVDISITVQDPPNAGIDKTVDRCDSDAAVVNFETEVGGTPGSWAATSALPSFGVVDIGQKKYTPADGDGGLPPTFGTPINYTFRKTVQATGVVPECACTDTADLTVRVYPRFTSGQSSVNNILCADGSSRNLRDLITGEESGGQWKFNGAILNQSPWNLFILDMYVNGVLQEVNGISNPVMFEGEDNGTIGFPPDTIPGDYRFSYRLPNQNTPCSTLSQVGFLVQSCGVTCNGNSPTINQNIAGNCVNATRGGSLTSGIAFETWTYRLSNTGTWLSYTPGTNVCGQPYVEFRYVLTFSDGCPAIERSTVYNVSNPTCNNTPTVSASFNTCQFTLTPGGTTNSPVSTSNIQWRYLGNTNWNTYSGPITISGTATIEYRRIVSYSDGCPQTTTSTQQLTGQCSTSCNVSIGVNANNNLLTASVTGCGNQAQSINWYYSVDGISYGGSIGTGYTLSPSNGAGYYKATLSCGNCSDEDIYQYSSTPAPCTGSVALSYANNILTASRTGCPGTITYSWQYSPTGSGWSAASGSANQNTLVPQDGPGVYRVITFCNGDCPLDTTYTIEQATCQNNPTVSCAYNTGTCQYTLTKTGSQQSQPSNDKVWWKEQGTLNIHEYSAPFVHNGPIEFQRTVQYFDDCPDVTTPWQTCSGTCCNGNSIDVNCSFSQATCQFTLTPVTSVISPIISDTIRWRATGTTTWNNYTGPFAAPAGGQIEFDRFVVFSGSCQSVSTPVKTCSGSCCTGNNPTVSAAFNAQTCQYTITAGGTNTNTIATDVLEWRQAGSLGSYTMYTGPFTGPSSIEVRRRVTYTNGCTASPTATASGNCCTGNNPGVSCSYNNSTCLFTLTNTGTVSSPISTDVVRWRNVGSSVWNTYSAPFSGNGQIEFQREVQFSNGCTTIITPVQTCQGTCCANNAPDVTCSFNGSDCKYTLTKTGVLASTVASDVVEWRPVGGGTWFPYSVPFVQSGNIEYRRTVTFTDGCSSITTSTKTCTGSCCTGNNPTVSCSYNPSTCTFTLSAGGTLNSPVASDTIYWRPAGSTVWNSYSAPFVNTSNIEFYRVVTFSNGCSQAATPVQSCTGTCCINNTPDVSCSFNGSTCQFTLTKTGTLVSSINSDIVEWRQVGSGTWNTYTGPFTNPSGNIEFRRVVDFSDTCSTITTPTKTCTGACCANNSIGVSHSFNPANCQHTITLTGTSTTAILTDVTEWRQQGSSGAWTTYSGPFTGPSHIDIRRTVTYVDSCQASTTGTGVGICCLGNTPDVTCSKDAGTCTFTLTKTGSSTSLIATDVVQWRTPGSGTWNTYTGPFANPAGSIEYRRTVTYSDGCASVTTAIYTCSGNCCTTNAPDASCSFNSSDCKFTLSPAGTNTSPTSSDVIQWRNQGSGGAWNTYSVPFTNGSPIEYRRVVTYSDGCTGVTSAVKTCSGLCCTGNNPTVSCSYNSSTCQFTLSSTGTNTSPIATDVIQWRPQGTTTWSNYSAPFNYTGSIEYRRTVTYSDGCATKISTTGNCSGTCCSTNQPDATCAFNSSTCHFTLTKTGTLTSAIATDVLQWRNQGSGGAWNTYSAPFQNASAIEYRRVLTFSDGCTGITTTVKTCSGTCCQGNNPDVTCNYNASTCKYELSNSGSNASPVASDIIQYRPAGGSAWNTYTGPVSFPTTVTGIEYRRVVTYSNGCPGVTTPVKSCSGTCCVNNNPIVTCQFDSQTCKYTLVSSGSGSQPIAVDIVYWRPTGGGSWNVYSGPFSHNGAIDYYRSVIYDADCPDIDTAIKTCTGACCGANTPGISCSFNPSDCKYTLTATGTNVSGVSSDVMEWRELGSTGSWTAYSVPFTGPEQIEARRRVTYTDSCQATANTTCGGVCCTGNSPDANCSYSNATCLYTLTNAGSVSSPVAADVIRWRPVGGSTWNTYSVPFAYEGQIEYQRVVTFSNGCPQATSSVKTCNGICCTGNNPDVSCSFSDPDCQYTLNRIGTNASSINTDVVEYRAVGSGTWLTYTAPFSASIGQIEFRRTVTYSDGCTTVQTAVKTCSGNCCDDFGVTASVVSQQLQANVTGCAGGTITVQWYYGTTAGNTNTFLGTGLTFNPTMGSGYYQARASCSVGGCQASHVVQFTCSGSASLNTSMTTLTVTGLSGCASPSYNWQYSTNGSSWVAATGGTNSASLTMQNGNGWYRVTILCAGYCPIVVSFQRDCNCTNTPVSVSAVKTTDFIVTATPTGCSGGTIYSWVASNGGQIQSGQGTSQITTNGKGTYYVQMTCNNTCGQSCSATSNQVSLCNCEIYGNAGHHSSCNKLWVNGTSPLSEPTGCNGTWTYLWAVTGGGGQIIGANNLQQVQTNGVGSYQVTITCSDCGSGICNRVIDYNYGTRCSTLAVLTANCCEFNMSMNCGGPSNNSNYLQKWEYSPNGTTGWVEFFYPDDPQWITSQGTINRTQQYVDSNGTDPLGNCSGYYRYYIKCGCGACIYSNVVYMNCCDPCGSCSCLSPSVVSVNVTASHSGSNTPDLNAITNPYQYSAAVSGGCKYPLSPAFDWLRSAGNSLSSNQNSYIFNHVPNASWQGPKFAEYRCDPCFGSCRNQVTIPTIELGVDSRVGGVTNFSYYIDTGMTITVKHNGVSQSIINGPAAAFPALGIWKDDVAHGLTIRVSGLTGTLEIKCVSGNVTTTFTHTW